MKTASQSLRAGVGAGPAPAGAAQLPGPGSALRRKELPRFVEPPFKQKVLRKETHQEIWSMATKLTETCNFRGKNRREAIKSVSSSLLRMLKAVAGENSDCKFRLEPKNNFYWADKSGSNLEAYILAGVAGKKNASLRLTLDPRRSTDEIKSDITSFAERLLNYQNVAKAAK